MTIAKYTNNLYASEVYRELERQAAKNGFFKPSETQQVKIAAQQVTMERNINKPIDSKPSDDFIQDVARLAYAMRRKGFLSQADDLEQKLVIYKQAENALYNVTPEKNQDFIGFAHRDGDVQIVDGGELGQIETIQSAAEKIRAVTLKQPTGKLASLAAEILKNAQIPGTPKPAEPEASGKPAEKAKLSDEIQGDVNTIKEHLKAVATSLGEVQNINLDDAITTFFQNDPGKQKAFNILGGRFELLDRLGKMKVAAYKGDQPNRQVIFDTIMANPNGANTYLKSIGDYSITIPNTMASLNTGLSKKAQSSPYMATGTAPQAQHQEIQKQELAKQQEQIRQQATVIANQIDTDYKKLEQSANSELTKVKAALQQRKEHAKTMSDGLNTMAAWNVKSNGDVHNFLIRTKHTVPQIRGMLSEVASVLEAIGKSNNVEDIRQRVELLDKAIYSLESRRYLAELENIPATVGRLNSIKSKLQKAIDDGKLKDRNPQETINVINNLIAKIEQNEANGEEAVLKAIGYGSWKEFDIKTQQLLSMVQKDIAGGK